MNKIAIAALVGLTLSGFAAVQTPASAQTPAVFPDAMSSDPHALFADSRMITLDRISVEIVGSGPDVILIPGLASSRETFKHTAERLKGRYRLHLIQVAGFAGEPARANASGPVVGPTTDEISAYIRHEGLKKVAIMGHSLGGVMALELAIDHPDQVDKVMIIDALAFYTELFAGPHATAEGAKPYAVAMASRMLAASDADYAKSSAQLTPMMVASTDYQPRILAWTLTSARPTVAMAIQEDMTTDLRPKMASITAPVTVIYESQLASLVQADYAPVPNKTLIAAAPSAKHFIMFDDPNGFDAAVDGFLKR
jgi:pimeloyl-ACP methyl ester carboxylesterase